MKVKLDEGAKLPTRAHDLDDGFDLYSREDRIVPAGGSACFNTGVHIELVHVPVCGVAEVNRVASDGTVLTMLDKIPVKFKTAGFLKSKSGLNIHHGITSEGVIDMGYTGPIIVKLYNHSETDYQVFKGDKISQLVILPVVTPELEVVDELKETERGDNGLGSTGR